MASGKGGVGKTTAAVNVARALTALGVRVGLVDADLYGPDAAHMMGLRRRASAAHVTLLAARGTRSARLQAAERHGVQIASAAFLIGEAQGRGVQAQLARLLMHRLISGTSWDAAAACPSWSPRPSPSRSPPISSSSGTSATPSRADPN